MTIYLNILACVLSGWHLRRLLHYYRGNSGTTDERKVWFSLSVWLIFIGTIYVPELFVTTTRHLLFNGFLLIAAAVAVANLHRVAQDRERSTARCQSA